MSSNYSYSKPKASAYAPRSTSYSSTSQSIYANSTSSRSNRGYGSKPTSVVIHNDGGQTSDGPTSSQAGNSGYYQ